MKVHLRLLRQGRVARPERACTPFEDSERVTLTAALQNDGWQLEQEEDTSLLAWHPEAQDERAARSRLHQLGLLTSSSLRIHFQLVSGER